jgi:hypothetical protein
MRNAIWLENLKERDNSEDPGIDGGIILEWTYLVQDRDQWLALVNTVMNLRVHKRRGFTSLTEGVLVSLFHGVSWLLSVKWDLNFECVSVAVNIFDSRLGSFPLNFGQNRTLGTKGLKIPSERGRQIRGCIQKFPDWPPGARTANDTALCH